MELYSCLYHYKAFKNDVALEILLLRFQKCQLHSVSLCEKHIILKTSFLWEFDLAEFGRTGGISLFDGNVFSMKTKFILFNISDSSLTLKVVGPHNIVSK